MLVVLNQDSRAVIQPAQCQDNDDMFPLIQQQIFAREAVANESELRYRPYTQRVHNYYASRYYILYYTIVDIYIFLQACFTNYKPINLNYWLYI